LLLLKLAVAGESLFKSCHVISGLSVGDQMSQRSISP